MATTHSDLHNGFSRYHSVRGTLEASTVLSIGISDDCDVTLPDGPAPSRREVSRLMAVSVLIYPPASGTLYAVLSNEENPDNVTDPTDDGTSDTNLEMLAIFSTDPPLAIDFATRTIKLIHTSAVGYRIVLIGS